MALLVERGADVHKVMKVRCCIGSMSFGGVRQRCVVVDFSHVSGVCLGWKHDAALERSAIRVRSSAVFAGPRCLDRRSERCGCWRDDGWGSLDVVHIETELTSPCLHVCSWAGRRFIPPPMLGTSASWLFSSSEVRMSTKWRRYVVFWLQVFCWRSTVSCRGRLLTCH
jgi:hypothetical protein